MEVREHDEVRPKHLRQPYYYSRWFNCRHIECKTTLVMPEKFKVWNDNEAARQTRRRAAIHKQLKRRAQRFRIQHAERLPTN